MARIKSTEQFQNIFSERLKAAREKQGLSQEKLSEIIGISTRTYQKYESDELANDKNRSIPNFEIVVELCKNENLDCDLTYLAGNGSLSDFKQSVKTSADYLGMKYDAVEKIQRYSPEIKQLLNNLILCSKGDNLLKLLEAIQAYAIYAHHSNVRLELPVADLYETHNVEDKLIGATSEIGNTLPDISKKMLKYAATSTLDDVLTNIYNDYIKEGNNLLRKRLIKEFDLKKKRILHLIEECKWRKLTINEFAFINDYQVNDRYMTEKEISEILNEEMDKKYELYKES